MLLAAFGLMPDTSGDGPPKADTAPDAKNSAEPETSADKSGHLIKGSADYEDVLDRLSKGVSVPSDLTNLGKTPDNS
jgi:hypothetical protein